MSGLISLNNQLALGEEIQWSIADIEGQHRIGDERGDAFKQVVVETGDSGVLTDGQQQSREVLQASRGHRRNLHQFTQSLKLS